MVLCYYVNVGMRVAAGAALPLRCLTNLSSALAVHPLCASSKAWGYYTLEKDECYWIVALILLYFSRGRHNGCRLF